MWSVVEPRRPLKWSWYLDAICDHLQAISEGKIRNLVINIPPRFLKSTIVSVMWPAWEWLHNPSIRYLTSSYAMKLAIRDAVRSRRIMRSARYQRMLIQREGEHAGEPLFVFTGDQNEKSRYENDKTGFRVCTAPGAGTTGEGGDRVVVDDPHNLMEVESDAVRKGVIEWWDEAMSTRINDPKTGAKVIVMQRLHEDDLTGHVLEQGGYEHLCLPTLFESDHPCRRMTCIGFEDPRTEDGEMLSPDHFGEPEIEEARVRLGTFGFCGQHQQRPTPASGGMFKKEWFRFYTSLPPQFDEEIQSWDLSFKGKDDKRTKSAEIARVKDPDFVVGDDWGFVGANAYLIDETRGQWEFKKAIEMAIRFTEQWPKAAKKLVEDKANGPAMMSLLNDNIPGLIPFDPGGVSKIQRARTISPFVEAGNVWLPHPSIAPWINDWLDEVCAFPFGRKDDRVDTMTQVLISKNVNELAATLRKLKAMSKM